jgi:hypothetical protein
MNGTALARLRALVANCSHAGVTRQALLLRLDRLPASLARPHHLRLAEAALSPLLRASRAELFRLPGPRLAMVWRGDAEVALLDVVDALDHLLDDAPASAPALPELVGLFDLPDDGDLLLAAMEDGVAPEPPPPQEAATKLDPASLTLLEASLAHADVSRFARRRAVWRLQRRQASLAWEERTLSVGELADGLVPGHDLEGEPWLFRRLTRTLDRRLLALLASPGELAHARPFALDLNLTSIVGAEFLRFDDSLSPNLRGRVVLALTPADVVADAGLFGFACGFARARDYRLMLRGATPGLLRVLPGVAMGMDYLSIPWSSSLPGDTAWLLDSYSADCLILTDCDTESALDWGTDHGIGLMMGAAMDRLALGEQAATT